jgi:D-lactate dehydrogenase
MKILVTDINEQWQKDYLSTRLEGNTLIFLDGSLKEDTTASYDDVDIVVNFISSPLHDKELAKFPNLKYVATRSTGYDHIAIDLLKNKGVAVSNVPAYGENTVAEHAFALMLALARKLPQSIARIKNGEFNYHGLRGWDIKGKTLGVIGGGHIGINLVKMAKGFGMEVMVFDIKKDSLLAEVIGFTYQEIDTIYAQADIISLHVPLNPHTAHMINRDTIAQMKEGVYIINTARGGLIDTEALLQGLKSGKIAGAGLDVLEGEEYINEELDLLSNPDCKDQIVTILGGHLLMELDNVIVTPHNAFNSVESVQRILETTADNILSFIDGVPQNVVNL